MSDAEGDVTVSEDGITVRKSLNTEQFKTPAVVFDVRSERETDMEVRITDRIPGAIPREDVGFHPEYGGEHWSIEEAGATFERTFEAGEEYTTVYGVRGVEEDIVEGLLDLDPEVEVAETEESGGSGLDNLVAGGNDLVRDVIKGERDSLPGVDGEEEGSADSSASEDEGFDLESNEGAIEADVASGSDDATDAVENDAASEDDEIGTEAGAEAETGAGDEDDFSEVVEDAFDKPEVVTGEDVEDARATDETEISEETDETEPAGEPDETEPAGEPDGTEPAGETDEGGAGAGDGETAESGATDGVDTSEEATVGEESSEGAADELDIEPPGEDADVESPAGDVEVEPPEGEVDLEPPGETDELDDASVDADSSEAGDGPGESSDEPPETGDEELTVPVSGGVARALATELREGRIDPEDRRALREELAVGEGSLDARIKHLQNRVSDLAAYTDALETFLDEHGAAEGILADVHRDLDDLAETTADLEETIAEVDDDLADVEDEIERLDGTVEDVEAELDGLHDGMEEFEDDLDALSTDVAGTEERIDDVADRVEEVSETVDAVEANTDRIDELEDDLADLRAEVEEIAEFRDQLSTAFGTGEE